LLEGALAALVVAELMAEVGVFSTAALSVYVVVSISERYLSRCSVEMGQAYESSPGRDRRRGRTMGFRREKALLHGL